MDRRTRKERSVNLMKKNIDFSEFMTAVSQENHAFIVNLHQELLHQGYRIHIKEARSGYVAAYVLHNKTIANYIFRKKGMLIRIYGAHVNEYEAVLDTLPLEMQEAISHAPVCKRLLDPHACNPKCSMGYSFFMKHAYHQKCRNGAFMFLLHPVYHPYIQSLVLHEAEAYRKELMLSQ